MQTTKMERTNNDPKTSESDQASCSNDVKTPMKKIDSDEPKNKIQKLDADAAENKSDDQHNNDVDQPEISLNELYLDSDLFEKLKSSWRESQEFIQNKPNVQLYAEPFHLAVLQDFLSDKRVPGLLLNEMEEEVDWSHKQMDLYEFDQTTSLSLLKTKYLPKFMHFLEKIIQPWLEKLCNIKLKSVSASCSMYNCGDYLLVHDDLLNDRQIAFVYYLSPWEEVDQWTDEMGGCLELFKTNESSFPCFPPVKKINPRNNQFVFFKVGSKSFHQVGEVTTSEYPRMTINGWFHGEINTDTVEDSVRSFPKMIFTQPESNKPIELEKVINNTYLKEDCKNHIQKVIEDSSEICLEEFLIVKVYEKICEELRMNDSLRWIIKGPANAQCYEILDLEHITEPVSLLVETFKSTQMFKLLQEYTDLDLSIPNANAPGVSFELQRWTPGCYTILGDGAMSCENTLDLMYFLNATDDVGVITYLSPEEENDSDYDEAVLLTIKPKNNALNLVYRCEGTTKFTKYVSKSTPIEKGPVFVMCCSYKE